MQEQWLHDYAVNALRLDKIMRVTTELPYVDGYYGPSEWQAIVETEPISDVSELIDQLRALAESLATEDFEPYRATRLRKFVTAMETVCRKLNGESISFEDEMQGYYDFRPEWVPETRFEEALETCNALLPGNGSLDARWYEWREQYQPTPEYTHLLLGCSERILREVHRRTCEFVDLPENESIQLRKVSDKPFDAANFYQGNFQTVIELNTDRPFNALDLVDTLSHECYPGHHTECILKDQHLYRGRGYIEHSVPIVLSPPCFISEGIAMLALEMIFAPGELDEWMREHLYPMLRLTPYKVEINRLRAAGDVLSGAQCNAMFMVREGRPDEEIREYLTRYLQPAGLLEHSRSIPFFESYVCSYYYGKQLLLSHLQSQGANQQAEYRRCLKEPIFASDLGV